MPRLYSWDPLPVSLTPDGRLAVAGNKDGELQLWDVHGGVCLKTLHVPGGGVRRVDISADGRFAVTAGSGGAVVRFWDLAGERCLRTLTPDEGHRPAGILSLRLSADARLVVAAAEEGASWFGIRTAASCGTGWSAARTIPWAPTIPRSR